MPNNPVVVSGAIIVVSVAVAAAIAVYESPQVRQYADDVRRRIAIALHSLGDEIHHPNNREPRFNRPEDAEGFLESRGGPGGVDADEESKRRQREELMYWNAVHLEKMAKERKLEEANRPANKSRGSSFDDFLTEDHSAEKGTYVYNSGADLNRDAEEGLVRRRGEGVRGLSRGSVYANPFSDENMIDAETQQAIDESLMSPEVAEHWDSGLYSAPARSSPSPSPSPSPAARAESEEDYYTASPRIVPAQLTTPIEQLVDISDPVAEAIRYPDIASGAHESAAFMAAREAESNAFADIHAWANSANQSFYSPLPTTPRSATPQQPEPAAPVSPVFSAFTDDTQSEPDVLRSGEATPTDSVSMAGDAPEEIWGSRSGATSENDVMSIDGDGISTPGSWTEVGSTVSENDVGVHH
ncbi:hypothetical protein PVAG01_10009 [Phlyctema vagabunda]|uniref:Uncharacterized protein n=1 Tax=Phlyctema vagabunda TaxID=108571 RepID=A0ABR4P4Q1_9HELO